MGHEFIGVDWGTSNMRAMLCETDGTSVAVRDVRHGRGVIDAQGEFLAVLNDAIAPWLARGGRRQVFMSGMVGSNFGWHETPYLPCPLDPFRLADHCQRFTEDGLELAILPGLKVENDSRQADVMRGEELQALGWLAADPSRASGRHLLCCPGTHTKWIDFVDGRIEAFTTAMSGELYGLLLRHSVLFRGFDGHLAGNSPDDGTLVEAAFDEGAERGLGEEASLLHSLFMVRSRQLLDKASREEAQSFLSGLIVGSDVRAATATNPDSRLTLSIVGGPTQTRLYSRALRLTGLPFEAMDGTDAAARGYAAIRSGTTR